jgi:multiple sugar transport system substrate-binding protein
MAHLTRRSVLRGSVALGAAHVFAAPHIARAAATTATVWFAQGFVQDEDVALRKAVADYEKASGNKIELSITPFAPERQKIIAALTSGVVPDMMANNPAEILQIYGWQDRWVDVSDVVDTQKALFSETALVSAQAYNNVTKKVGTYGVPLRAAVVPCHIWRPLVEKAGLKIEDIPKTWDAYFDFFKKVQDNLRKQGERKVYGLGFQVTANGVDPTTCSWRFSLPMAVKTSSRRTASCISTTRRSSRRRSRRPPTSAALTATATCPRARSTGTTPTTTMPSTQSSW